ncbi:MAG: hypothetical protein NTW21_32650 [Verrucomicrobia bacterium]|nr:hypothetical protein [Verrucomicrobiota bacterium]
MKDVILLLEDDPQQSAIIMAAVERQCPNAEVELLETESDFYARIDRITPDGSRPLMVISDVMMPWAFPDPAAPAPPRAVVEGTFRNAGFRCWEQFRQRDDMRCVPWIYFTVLEDKTIECVKYTDERTGYVHKGNSIEPLLQKIDEFLKQDGK